MNFSLMRPLVDADIYALIQGIYKKLPSKEARIAFKTAITTMVMKGGVIKTQALYERVGANRVKKLSKQAREEILGGLREDGYNPETLAKSGPSQMVAGPRLVTQTTGKNNRWILPSAWRERMAELMGMLPSVEVSEPSMVKNWGCKANKAYPGISTKRRNDTKTLTVIGPENNPAVEIIQDGYGPWTIVDGKQVAEPEEGQHTITWKMVLLSGVSLTATASIQVKKKQVSFRLRAGSKREVPYWGDLKSMIARFIKFGPCPESGRDTYTVNIPNLLSPAEQDELIGLVAADMVAKEMNVSKSVKGAKRPTMPTTPVEPSTEEDEFRDKRVASSIQKRTNRRPEEGIGEYAGGGQYEVTDGTDFRPVVEALPKCGMSIVDGRFLKIRDLVRRLISQGLKNTRMSPKVAKMMEQSIRGCAADLDDRVGHSKEEMGKGWLHPARSFRLGLFGKYNPAERKWVRDAMPVIYDRATGKTEPCGGWVYRDFRGLREAIYHELEQGDLLFWAESYQGKWSYVYGKGGLMVPPTPKGRRLSKEVKALRCQHCGSNVWRQDLHAEVCDSCDSDAFPRTWIWVLIPMKRLLPSYVVLTDDKTKAEDKKVPTHAQIRLYGKAVGWVVREALARGADITAPRTEMVLIQPEPKRGQALPSPVRVQAPVGLGRFLWGPNSTGRISQHTCREEPPTRLGRKYKLPTVFTSDPATGHYDQSEGYEHGC